ncbi:uncharacterized protein BO66DRAFT_221194 [Aspergillus aculeatinus CBS 121060]|uniref:Uncharacterized protein n=1 Tax=Aspergillus aculeatinus CBS 121060 TaxID=1448322 RepID=A0ACD1HHW5_9EURO|nr:hypothetical protein BO66DRAFT_221194 [Aspergillus aculeatinus CBS 121060]RAH73388.1 hypothetical protein BO66DRAFT_221194 [Aspergillus aculeatinus CBS 121060]
MGHTQCRFYRRARKAARCWGQGSITLHTPSLLLLGQAPKVSLTLKGKPPSMHSGRLRKAYVNKRRLCRELSKKLQRSIALPLLGLQGPLPLPPLSCNPRGTPQLAAPRNNQAKTIYMQVYLSLTAPLPLPSGPLSMVFDYWFKIFAAPHVVGREGWKRGDTDR